MIQLPDDLQKNMKIPILFYVFKNIPTLVLIKRILLQRFICSTLDGTYVLSVPQTADTTLRFHQTISKKSQSSKV